MPIRTENFRVMKPEHDVVCCLLQTPFCHWKEDDKRDLVLKYGRPTNTLGLEARKSIKTTKKSYTIHFRNVWFDEYKWLCSSATLQKLFCWPCLLFSNKFSTFNKEGFSDLTNVSRSLTRHGDTAEHLRCDFLFRNFVKDQNSLSDAVKENLRIFKIKYNENVRINRLFLQAVIDAVIFLSKLELSFHGHDESVNGLNCNNFNEVLALFIEKTPMEVQKQYEKIKNVFASDLQNIQHELIQCISDYIDDHVSSEISESQFFSIQVDDITDISQTSQCSLIIRLVNSEGTLVERFLGFHDVSEDRTAENLYKLIDGQLYKFNYEQKLIGQCYDGASVMLGHLKALQKKIKDEAPQSVLVHSLAPHVNLVLQQSLSKIVKCRIFFASISGMSSFFRHSDKWNLSTAKTRWSSSSKLLSVIVEDWDMLKEVFELLINNEQSDCKTINTARGFLRDMNNFYFTFLAYFFNDIFSHTDSLFKILQEKSLDINYWVSQIQRTTHIIKSKGTDAHFKLLFVKASGIAKINFSENNCVASEEIYKQLYYDILNHILVEMGDRFDNCDKLLFISLTDTSKFKNFSSCFPMNAFENLKKNYGSIFTKEQRLKNELGLIYADEKLWNISIEELVRELHEQRDLFTETYKLVSIVATLPSTNVSVPKSFPCIKRMKTFSRNAIAEGRLSALTNISTQKEFLLMLMKKEPFYDDIIDKYASLNGRKIHLIIKP